uniref:Uncharacterized protein n=1 Tax=Arundo donax TaxID=35708 RepID=A0A0A8YUF9_ARUDO
MNVVSHFQGSSSYIFANQFDRYMCIDALNFCR